MPWFVLAINEAKLVLNSIMLFFFLAYSLTSFSNTSAIPLLTPFIKSLISFVSIYLSATACAITGKICLDRIEDSSDYWYLEQSSMNKMS